MSWQLSAFAILFGALAGGFAWYERARPDARVVALVATLAAFAALGRIAFAALPNVKPTTDIVLISGYALGPAPGFVVGAVAGLTSNFFFGQGPWTPWQMVGWGLTGLIGAAVGRATGRQARRWPLALVCLVVGFGFTALQDVGDWVNYSDHSPAQLGVYVGKGLGFDAVHAAGCLVFALAFGPALARSLARFAARLDVAWRTAPGAASRPAPAPAAGRIVASLVLFCLATTAWLAGAPGSEKDGGGVAAARAATAGSPAGYLLSAQNADGGFGPAPGQGSNQLFSGWAALGLAADGHDPGRVSRGGHTLLAYLRSGAAANADPGSIERTILAAAAAGANPKSFGGHDLVAALEDRIGRDGSVSNQTNLTSFAVLALRAAAVAPPPRTLPWLVAQEDLDGGFNFATAGGASDVDDTGAALEALAGDPAPVAARARRRAVAFITRQQNRDGGFGASAGAASNAQSTSWAVQGLIAAGTNPRSLRGSRGRSPLTYLDSLTAADGHIRYSRQSDQTPVWVTAEAAMALAAKPLPLAAPAQPRVRPHVAHRKAVNHAARRGKRPAPKARHSVDGAADSVSKQTLGLATDAGILDAVALAPIGVG